MEQEKLASTDNSSLTGDFSVLTPSQKRALEKAEEEEMQKEAAKKRKREEAKLEKERKIKQHKRKIWGIGIPLFLVCTILFGISLNNYYYDESTTWLLLSILFGVGFAVAGIYIGIKTSIILEGKA